MKVMNKEKSFCEMETNKSANKLCYVFRLNIDVTFKKWFLTVGK